MSKRFSRVGGLALVLVNFALADVQARTFHVDAVRGDDAQDGLKPETAWRSLTRVNRASLAPGDQVLFRRGQAWRGQLLPRSGEASGSDHLRRLWRRGQAHCHGFSRCRSSWGLATCRSRHLGE